MQIINNEKEFLEWVKDSPLNKTIFEKTYYSVGVNMLKLSNIKLSNLNLSEKEFSSTEFESCIFDKCKLENTLFHNCTFINCIFKECSLYEIKFIEIDLINCPIEQCDVVDVEIADGIIRKLKFNNCSEILDLQLRSGQERDISFINSYISFLNVEHIEEKYKEKLNFNDCLINNSKFDRIDFTKSVFKNCSLSLNAFNNCILSEYTLAENNETPSHEYNFIDIRTIIISSNQTLSILQSLFGIHNSEIKEYLIGMTSEIIFQSIFISYSFKDKDFAHIINEELNRRGIITFMWEKDAPGGKQLKDIMKEGIRDKDRVLFIASKNSLKSRACHYELTQGRKKQEEIWEEVLFPIHIDNYLFELERSQIRPLEKQLEYWENIEELKSLNSIDFTKFSAPQRSLGNEFDKVLLKLIKGLRKDK